MYRSVEVRWFLPGDVDPAVAAWVNDGRPAVWTGPGRRDVYLVLPGVDSLGLKLRGEEITAAGRSPGRFEVKARVACRAPLEASMGAVHLAGHVEEWLKWSYVGDALQPFVAPLLDHPTRVVVDKQRLRRKHDLTVGRPFPRVSLATEVPRGAFLELTVVQVGPGSWWSLGIEAFGSLEDGGLESAFRGALSEILRDAPRDLGLADSYSYPGWLSTLPPQVDP